MSCKRMPGRSTFPGRECSRLTLSEPSLVCVHSPLPYPRPALRKCPAVTRPTPTTHTKLNDLQSFFPANLFASMQTYILSVLPLPTLAVARAATTCDIKGCPDCNCPRYENRVAHCSTVVYRCEQTGPFKKW